MVELKHVTYLTHRAFFIFYFGKKIEVLASPLGTPPTLKGSTDHYCYLLHCHFGAGLPTRIAF